MMAQDTEDQRSPQRRLVELQIEHGDLNAMIDQMAEGAAPLDELRMRRLKKRRLALRDEMTRLQWLIEPREPA